MSTQPDKITVLIVDDHAMVREGLRNFLELHDHIDVVGEAVNGEDAIQLTRQLAPNVVLMDLVMPQTDGITATKTISRTYPETKVIALTSFGEEEKVIAAVRAGADGYLLKNVSPPELVRAIEDVCRGDAHLHPKIARTIMDQVSSTSGGTNHTSLTSRELEILGLITQGLANQEIAHSLGIAVKTVKVHVSNILKKLDVADRTQAAVYALKMGLTTDESGI